MNDDDIANFKIRLDDESPDEALNDAVEKTKPQPPSSNRKIYVLFIILLISVAVGLGAVYMDIKKRVAANINAGTTVVNNISKEVTTNLAAVTARQEALEEKINKSLSALVKSTSDINNRLKKLSSVADSLQVSKSDKNDVKKVVTEFENKISAIQSSIDAVTSQTTGLNNSFKQQIASVRNDISGQGKKVEVLGRDVTALSAEKLDKKTYEKSIQNENDRYADTLGKLNKDIEFIRYKIKIMEERLPAPLKGSEPPANLIPGDTQKGISEQTIH